MSWTKQQFVLAALEEIGIASYTFDIQPEQLESGLVRLDAMMSEWNGKGLRLSYPIPSSPENSRLDDESNVPDYANQAVILNLAVNLAPSYGREILSQTRTAAARAYKELFGKVSVPLKKVPCLTPLGAGYKRRQFSATPDDCITLGPDTLSSD